jgi:hypothetical protein
MLSRFDSAAAPALQHVTEIHRQQVFRRRHINPLTAEMAGLQPGNAVLRQ